MLGLGDAWPIRTFSPFCRKIALSRPRRRLRPVPGSRLRSCRRCMRRRRSDPNGFWADLARRELHWQTPFTVTLDDSKAPNYRWFTDGQLNVSCNCLDVHLAERGHKTAIIFEGEPGDTRRLSYRELHAEVCRFANALKAQGVEARRSRRHLHAAGAGSRSSPCTLRAHRRDSLGGVRRLLGAVAQGPHRGCRGEAGHHRRRRLARRQRRRAEGGGRQGARRRLRAASSR